MRTRAPLLVRLVRFVRLAAHSLHGWLISYRIARSEDPAVRERLARDWSRRLLQILAVRITFHDAPEALPRGAVLVSNHMSWLDIFAIYAHTPGAFISKSEVRAWPLIGGVIERAGSIFIERGSARHARSVNAHVVAVLEQGAIVCIFPEGVTGDGDVLHSFHSALFQPAIDGRATIVPIALRYTDPEGRHSMVPNYVGETSLLTSLWSVLSHTGLCVEVHFLPHFSAAESQRRALARQTETLISTRLGLAIKRKHNETRADPPDERQSDDRPTHNPYPEQADSV